MAIVTGDRYLEKLVKFVDDNASALIEGTVVLKLNPVGLHYVQSRLDALRELEGLITGAPVDYLRAYISDLGDHRALDKLGRILRLLTSLKVVSVLPPPSRDPTPLSLLPFGRLRVLELRGCDLSTNAARGLLELRSTLEKLVCHNSTDALRHVFASRIVEVKESPQWNKLSFVSCACNGLALMDESLQLLPVVETLDLSRNKFTKVDNLHKCTKLKHLDLGFNHLRTIRSFSEVSCLMVNLVLRNNALTTLHGIENLKSLEGLDVSYNTLSNLSELEFLEGILTLRSLWLEGNPLCCTRWYRAHVFSFFTHPENLKLDDMEMSAQDHWKRRIIIAHKHKTPASFGYYFPAKEDMEGAALINKKTKRATRLVDIETEEESPACLDQESLSCNNEIQSRENNFIRDDEAEIAELMNRIALLKKERSDLWLQELREWMDQDPGNLVDGSINSHILFHPRNERHMKGNRNQRHAGENSRYVCDSIQASGNDSTTNFVESDSSFLDTPANSHGSQYCSNISLNQPGMGGIDSNWRSMKCVEDKGVNGVSSQISSTNPDGVNDGEGHETADNVSVSPLVAIDIRGSHVLSPYPSSPPHYQEDILHRRHNLAEEILHSSSTALSDSDSSSSEENFIEQMHFIGEVGSFVVDGSSSEEIKWEPSSYYYTHSRRENSHVRENGNYTFDSHAEQPPEDNEVRQVSLQMCGSELPSCSKTSEIFGCKEADWLEKRKMRRKTKKRVIALREENGVVKEEASQMPSTNMCNSEIAVQDEKDSQIVVRNNLQEVDNNGKIQRNRSKYTLIDDNDKYISSETLSPGNDDLIVEYFNKEVADGGNHEICKLHVRCKYVQWPESVYREREVALLLSSEDKLYVLHINVSLDDSCQLYEGKMLSIIGCHRVGDVKEVLVGIGLQILRIYMEEGLSYLIITGSIEKSKQVLQMLPLSYSDARNYKSSLKSLEQVQVELFDKQVCGCTQVCMFQYSIVSFLLNNSKEELRVLRSLFVIGGYVVVCTEDLLQFCPLLTDSTSHPYFSLQSCCSIASITELVLEVKENLCVTLVLDNETPEILHSTKFSKKISAFEKVKETSGSGTWKLNWFSVDSLFNFVSLLKAIHETMSTSPMTVRRLS